MKIYSIDLLNLCITQRISQGYYLNKETAEAAMNKLKEADPRRSLCVTEYEVNED